MRYVTALWLSLIFSASAQAGVIFENAWDTNQYQGPAWCSSCGSTWRTFDTFTLDSAANIGQIDAELWMDNRVSSVNYSIWDSSRTTQLFSQTIARGDLLINTGWGYSNRFTSATISGLSLGAGTYALSIWDGGASGTLGWHAARSSNDGSNMQCYSPTDNQNRCYSRRGDQTMRLHAVAVPEPGVLGMFAMGLIALTATRRLMH